MTQTQTQIQTQTQTQLQDVDKAAVKADKKSDIESTSIHLECDVPKNIPSSKGIVKLITTRVLGMIAEEMNSQEVQVTIKQKLIVPLINMIYRELYPYIISLIVTIIIILLLSLMTFLCFLLYYFKK